MKKTSDFQSEFFEDADDLVRAKDEAWGSVKTRRERQKIVRQFTNMLNTLSDQEAEELGRTEITNHGLTHRAMLQVETVFTSMVTVTNALVEVIVDTDNPERDLVWSQRISEAINRGAVHFKGKFANFWRKVAGEITIAGGCPTLMPKKYGWLPSLRPDMFFPKDTGLDADGVTYAFDPVELSYDDLKKMLASVGEREGRRIKKKNVEKLLEALKEQVRFGVKEGISTQSEDISTGVLERGTGERYATISAWWFYEVKYNQDGSQYVSATLFTDGVGGLLMESSSACSAQVIAFIEKAYESPSDWLHMIFVDSEIGGVKNVDTTRGIAEMIYPSAVDMEELLNLILEGDKIRARPKMVVRESADVDAVARWNIMTDLYAPDGVEEMVFKTGTAPLQTPMNLLSQNAAGLASDAFANQGRGGELRQQALERQQNSAMLQTNRVSEGYNHLDSILETVVWRLLAGPVKPGTEGYMETKWVRAYLERYEIPLKELAKREHGRFLHLRVRARRTIGNGDRVNQLDTSNWLMSNIMSYPPGARPQVLQLATLLQTQDPDLTERLVQVPKAVINAQKITAENENDTIRRRALLGQSISVGLDDIHQDHIPIHLLDMQTMLAEAQFAPWTRRTVIEFAAMSEHVGEHLQVLLGNPATNPEAKAFLRDYQNIVQEGQRLAQDVQEQESQANGLSPKDQAELEIKAARLQLDAQKFGAQLQDMQGIDGQRQARSEISRRSQYAKEIDADRRLQLERDRLALQAEAQNQTE